MFGKAFTGLASKWLNLPLRVKGLVVVLTLPVTLIVAVATLAILSVVQNSHAGVVIGTSLKARAEITETRTLMLAAESGLRGFVATGQEEFLVPYRDIGKKSNESIAGLEVTARHSATQTLHVRNIRGLSQATLDSMASVLQFAQSEARTPQGMEVQLSRERQSMEQLESEFAKLQSDEDRLLAEWAVGAKQRGWRSFFGVVLAVLMGIAAGIGAIMLFTTGIVRRLQLVQANATALAAGLPLEQVSSSDDEIGRLASALKTTSELLIQRDRRLSESQDAYRKQNAVLESILKRMGDGVVVADEKGNVLIFNPAAEHILGVCPNGQHPTEWVDHFGFYLPDKVTKVPAEELPLARAMRGERVDAFEILVRNGSRPDGVWIHSTGRPLTDQAGSSCGAIVVFRDVTPTKRIEAELRQAKSQAEDANHAKSEFLSRMSHELRTPLNAILGFAQVLEMDTLTPDQEASVRQILKGGQHLLALINEVLDIARIEAGRLTMSPEPVLLTDVIDETVDLVAPLAAHSEISITREPSVLWTQFINADRQRLKQVLLNILSNAIKYNRRHGSVSIAISPRGAERVRIEISDTGRGIPRNKMDLLFSPFERLGAEETGIEGSGVGLCLSRKLVQAMNGEIGAASEFGNGSLFWVEFAVTEGPVERYHRSLRHEVRIDHTDRGSATLLYVEDNLSNGSLMERILAARPGVKLLTAMQGRMGLALAREHRPDLILLDLHLPDLNGDAVLRQLRSAPETREIPVAMVSADATPGQIERLLAAGAKAYLTKPLDVKRLLSFIDDVLKEREAVPFESERLS